MRDEGYNLAVAFAVAGLLARAESVLRAHREPADRATVVRLATCVALVASTVVLARASGESFGLDVARVIAREALS